MHAAMWFELVVYFHVKLNPWCMGALVEITCSDQQKTNMISLIRPVVPVALIWTFWNADMLIDFC
jgi:hypothetical protein